jgi:uncharacterized protein (DUF342 family)
MGQEEPADKGLAFRLSEDGRALQAVFTPPEARQPLDSDWIRTALAEQGFGALFLDKQALDELIKKCGSASEPFSFDIGERRDGRVSVTLASDKMAAYLSITPPYGGRAADRQQVLDALKAAGVVSGILDTEIEASLAAGQVEARLVARGRPPVPGDDTEFKSLIPEMTERHPKVDEHGIADYRDLGLFVTVKAGTELMRRLPATPGMAGENVLGETVPQQPGKEIPFAPGLSGAVIAPHDRNLLIAAIGGQPVHVQNGVTVEPTLSVQNVDLSTGNLSFEGTVNIAADVKSGMKIKASGDVIVGGMVEAAEIEAGGDITVKGGIIGHGEIRSHGDDTHTNAARIRCGGSISARFIQNASVEAGNCIVVREAVEQSGLTAINQVVVGAEGSNKGHIIGGRTRATLLVQAAVAGSPSGVNTVIEVGVNPLIQGKLDAVSQRLKRLEKEEEELARVISRAGEHPGRFNPELLQKAERTREKLRLGIAECTEEKKTLQAQLSLADNAKVVIGQKVHGGVHVRIGNKILHVENEHGSGTFRLAEEKISFG